MERQGGKKVGGDAYDVDVPLSAFIAGFQTPQPTQNVLAQFEGKQLVITWPMPFASGAMLGLVNTGDKPFQGGLKVEAVSTPTAFFSLPPSRGGRSNAFAKGAANFDAAGQGCGHVLRTGAGYAARR